MKLSQERRKVKMVETAEKLNRPRTNQFRKRLCQGLGLDPRNPQTGLLALLEEHRDVAAVAIALGDSLRNNKPFNGTRPLSPQVIESNLLAFAIEVVRKSENAPQVLPEEMGMEEDMGMEYVMQPVTLRLRAVLGCNNTQAARYIFSWKYWQRLQEVTHQPK